jgi:hypothetical protein
MQLTVSLGTFELLVSITGLSNFLPARIRIVLHIESFANKHLLNVANCLHAGVARFDLIDNIQMSSSSETTLAHFYLAATHIKIFKQFMIGIIASAFAGWMASRRPRVWPKCRPRLSRRPTTCYSSGGLSRTRTDSFRCNSFCGSFLAHLKWCGVVYGWATLTCAMQARISRA